MDNDQMASTPVESIAAQNAREGRHLLIASCGQIWQTVFSRHITHPEKVFIWYRVKSVVAAHTHMRKKNPRALTAWRARTQHVSMSSIPDLFPKSACQFAWQRHLSPCTGLSRGAMSEMTLNTVVGRDTLEIERESKLDTELFGPKTQVDPPCATKCSLTCGSFQRGGFFFSRDVPLLHLVAVSAHDVLLTTHWSFHNVLQ